MKRPTSPKRTSKPEGGRAGWYNYYAGFPTSFVKDVIQDLGSSNSTIVLDPWNGSGTTTQVAHDLSVSCFGYDINPAMVLVSKARLLGPEVSPSESALCEKILESARVLEVPSVQDDPLETWFAKDVVASLRRLEAAIRTLLVPKAGSTGMRTLTSLGQVSSLAAFFYVALFRTVRELLQPFRSSNPTWIRTRVDEPQRLMVSSAHVAALLRKHVAIMAAEQFHAPYSGPAMPADRNSTVQIDLGDSRALPNKDRSIDLVIGSPPYCTRIDYAMATLPELAVLGFEQEGLQRLRRRMLGTATVEESVAEPELQWGRTCRAILQQIREHPSRASASYYWKNAVQYFGGLYDSVTEVARVLRPTGHCVIVVQDSYYKEVFIDLPKIVEQMARKLGLARVHRFKYPSLRHVGRINANASHVRNTATETVLVFSSDSHGRKG